MTFTAITFFCGVIATLVYVFINNKLQLLRINFNQQIQALTERINALENTIPLKHTEIRNNHSESTEPSIEISGSDVISTKLPVTIETDTELSEDTEDFIYEQTEPPQHEPSPIEATAKPDLAVETPLVKVNTMPKKNASATTRTKPRPYPSPKKKQQESQFPSIDHEIDKLLQLVLNYFKTGNTVVKIGLVILFFGISFLIKFTAEQGYLPVELRLAAAALGGVILTQLGWRLRRKKPDYALAVQGGGIGILFITTFASLKLYSLIPTPLAFIILVGLAAFTAWLAVVQNSKSLAIFGIVGGFVAPVLVSAGQGNHIILFGYYALLNCGVFAVAWFKSWRILNLIGFTFTYIISSAWGYLSYQSQFFWSIEPFLLIFFISYVAIPVLFAKRQEPNLKGYVDGTLVFGNAIIAFALQLTLVHAFEYASAFSALFASLFYLILARWLFLKKNTNFMPLVESFMVLGTIFATITIPLAFNGQLTAAVWSVEAAGIYWLSLKQQRIALRIFSSILLFASGFIFIADYQTISFGPPILNSFYLGCLMIAASSLGISYLGFKHHNKLSKDEASLVPIFFIIGNLWWIIGGYLEIEYYLPAWWYASSPSTQAFSAFPAMYAKNLSTAYVTVGLLLCSILGRKLNWHYLTKISFTGIAFMAVLALRVMSEGIHPFAYAGCIVWPVTFACYYFVLKNNEGLPNIEANYFKYGHAGTLWMLAIVGAGEMGWLASHFALAGTAWEIASYAIAPLGLSALVLLQEKKISWPVNRYYNDYLLLGISPILTLSWIWVFFSNFYSAGNSYPLLYIPILNPLEAVQALFMIILPIWLFELRKIKHIEKLHIVLALAGTYFLWLNGVLMRAIHQFANVPFDFSSLFSSPLVQMSLSIYWSIIGITLMILATKKINRSLWLSGGALMGIVVIKLFLLDLANSGTIERIISFISVGVILLLVGYFSPIPPKPQSEQALSDEEI